MKYRGFILKPITDERGFVSVDIFKDDNGVRRYVDSTASVLHGSIEAKIIQAKIYIDNRLKNEILST